MNKITIHGNLTKDVEIGEKDGKQHAHFTIASDRGRSDNAGTDFLPCAAFGEWVEDLRDLRKGVFVKVAGNLCIGEYDGKRTFQVIARSVERVAPKTEQPAQ
jgi:single-stranded DNA-binding protein